MTWFKNWATHSLNKHLRQKVHKNPRGNLLLYKLIIIRSRYNLDTNHFKYTEMMKDCCLKRGIIVLDRIINPPAHSDRIWISITHHNQSSSQTVHFLSWVPSINLTRAYIPSKVKLSYIKIDLCRPRTPKCLVLTSSFKQWLNQYFLTNWITRKDKLVLVRIFLGCWN